MAHLMFQPKGPNLRRSWMTAWKKDSANSSFFQGPGLEQLSNPTSERSLYPLFTFAFTPLGGSFVSLIPFWSTRTGKICGGNRAGSGN